MQFQLTDVTLKVHGGNKRHFIVTAYPDSLKHWKKGAFSKAPMRIQRLCVSAIRVSSSNMLTGSQKALLVTVCTFFRLDQIWP